MHISKIENIKEKKNDIKNLNSSSYINSNNLLTTVIRNLQ